MGLFQKSIKVSELNAMDESQLKRVIDVRSKAEYKQEHVKGTKNVPLEKLVNNPTAFIKAEGDYCVICQSGMRSKRAISLLKKQGYQNLTNVKGGYITYARFQNN